VKGILAHLKLCQWYFWPSSEESVLATQQGKREDGEKKSERWLLNTSIAVHVQYKRAGSRCSWIWLGKGGCSSPAEDKPPKHRLQSWCVSTSPGWVKQVSCWTLGRVGASEPAQDGAWKQERSSSSSSFTTKHPASSEGEDNPRVSSSRCGGGCYAAKLPVSPSLLVAPLPESSQEPARMPVRDVPEWVGSRVEQLTLWCRTQEGLGAHCKCSLR